jgi:prepilin peptidase CpaA
MWGNLPILLLSTLLVLLLLFAAVTDIRSRIISNRLNLAIALLAPVWWWANGMVLYPDVPLQLGLALAIFALFTIVFAMGLMGGGDVKLLGALALWFPFPAMASLLVIMAIAGGAITIVTLVHHRIAGRQGQPEVPYGVAIAIAGIWVIGARYLNHLVQ